MARWRNAEHLLPWRARRKDRVYWYAATIGPVLFVELHWESGYPLAWGSSVGPARSLEHQHSLVMGAVNMAIKRRDAARNGEGASSSPPEPESVKKFPHLVEFLTETKYEDGSERKTGTLFIFVQDGVWKGMVKDPDAGEVLWTTADGLFGLLKVMDGKVSDDKADWRRDRNAAVPAHPGPKKRGRREG